ITIQAIWYQSACRAWKRTFRERSLYISQTSRAPKGMRPTINKSTLRWAIIDHVRSSCALIVPAEAPAWPSGTRSLSPPTEVGVLLHLLSFRPCLRVCLYTGPTMIALQGTPTHPPNELFSEVLSSGGELPRRLGNNRMELDVREITQIIVRAGKRSDLCLLYASRNMGRGLRGARA